MKFPKVLLLIAMLLLLAPTTSFAEKAEDADDTKSSKAAAESGSTGDEKDAAEPAESDIFERVRVAGRPDERIRIPGSVDYLDEETLREQGYTDIHRIVGLIPGVNIQQEDGYGLRPNIGMRGTGVERSSKITLLEDGVLAAPAPYSAPSAYYFPTAGRMAGIEVHKGSASIQQGPYTNGGVLNMLSSPIPDGFGGDVDLMVGNNSTLQGRVRVGDSSERFGWLFETFQNDTEGFKNLDNGGETGFDLQDYMAKVRFTSDASSPAFHAFELKLGKTTQFGNETYLGLSQADFDADPNRRYAASQEDNIDTDHEQIQARYLFRPNERFDLTVTAYNNDFFRNWRKLERVNGIGVANVLADPTTFAGEFDILRADLAADSADDALSVRNNRRDYYSRGLDLRAGLNLESGNVTHALEFGARYHEDQEDRFQEEDGFRMTSGGVMQLTSFGAPGSQANRISDAEAVSLFVRDTISVGRWAFTPGVRLESIDFERRDFADAARTTLTRDPRQNSVDEVIPGVGASYEIQDGRVLFVGVHRGFSPPGPGAAQETRVEESVNYELGYRHHSGGFQAEVIGFFNDYDNLLGVCTVSVDPDCDVGDVFNGGKVEVQGLELSLRHDLTAGRNAGFSAPVSLVYTFTDAQFSNSFESDFGPWGDVLAGDNLPYLPEQQATLSAGLVFPRFATHANVNLTSEARTDAGQGAIPQAESIDAQVTVDWSARYTLRSNLDLQLQVRNLFDEQYVVSRRPAGLRPGIDRTVLAGVRFGF